MIVRVGIAIGSLSIGVALWLMAMAIFAFAAHAQTSTAEDDCLVTQAADAAVQRQLALLDSVKVNPQQFFSGPQSCISSALLQSFNLANFIPDLAGLLTGGVEGIINNVLNSAQQQVCQVLNDQMVNVIHSLNSSSSAFDSSLTSQLRGLLGTSRPIRAPNVPSFGQYAVSQPPGYGSLFGGAQPAAYTPPLAAQVPAEVPPAATSTPSNSSSSFGSTLFGQ